MEPAGYEAEHGEITEEDLAEVRAQWPSRLGLGGRDHPDGVTWLPAQAQREGKPRAGRTCVPGAEVPTVRRRRRRR